MPRFFYTCLLMVCFSLAWAQQPATPLDAQQNLNALGADYSPTNNLVRTFDNRFKGVVGSPFLLPDWMPGRLVTPKGDVYHDIQLRFDLVKEEVHILSLSGKENVLSQSQVAEFSLLVEKEPYHFRAFPDPKSPEEYMFCQVSGQKAVQVLVRRSKYLIPGNQSQSTYNSQPNDEYKFRRDQLYLRLADGDIHKLKRSQKAILKLLNDQEAAMKAYFRQEKPFLQEDQAIMDLIAYYNQLTSEK